MSDAVCRDPAAEALGCPNRREEPAMATELRLDAAVIGRFGHPRSTGTSSSCCARATTDVQAGRVVTERRQLERILDGCSGRDDLRAGAADARRVASYTRLPAGCRRSRRVILDESDDALGRDHRGAYGARGSSVPFERIGCRHDRGPPTRQTCRGRFRSLSRQRRRRSWLAFRLGTSRTIARVLHERSRRAGVRFAATPAQPDITPPPSSPRPSAGRSAARRPRRRSARR